MLLHKSSRVSHCTKLNTVATAMEDRLNASSSHILL